MDDVDALTQSPLWGKLVSAMGAVLEASDDLCGHEWSLATADMMLRAAVGLRSDVKCETCSGTGTDSCGISDAPCPDCNGFGTVSSPYPAVWLILQRAEVEHGR